MAIACATGAAKGVFVHGVLAAFEERGFTADLYAAASSSTIPAAFAAIHDLRSLGETDYWLRVGAAYHSEGLDMGAAVKRGIKDVMPTLADRLFAPGAAPFALLAGEVITKTAAAETQGDGARQLGRRLLLGVRKQDRSWADEHLAGRLFTTARPDAPGPWNAVGPDDVRGFASAGPVTVCRLTPDNLADALYATTRMLHAWKDPGWIDGRPFVDASYTSSCPVREVAALGAQEVIAITPEAGPFYLDVFRSQTIQAAYGSTIVHSIQPEVNLAEVGVDYANATPEGLTTAFAMGRDAGEAFIRRRRSPARLL